MTFGTKVRQLRHTKGWSLRDLAEKVGVGFTYLSRVENERLNFGDYPSDALIHRLADALEANEDELLKLINLVLLSFWWDARQAAETPAAHSQGEPEPNAERLATSIH